MTQEKSTIDPDTTYLRRLEREIAATERYLLDADRAIKHLEQELQLESNNNTTERSHKEHIIALQQTYEKLPWIPDKNEVLDTAIASVEISDLNKQQLKSITLLRNNIQMKKEEVTDLEQLLIEYQQLIPLLDIQEEESQRIQDLLETRSNDDLQSTPDSFLQDLGTNKEHTQQTVKMLQRGLTRILRKYIAISDYKSGNSTPVQQATLRDRLAEAYKLVRNLLSHVSSNSWVEVDLPTETEETLITTWIINDILLVHEDSIPGHHYKVKFRSYGV